MLKGMEKETDIQRGNSVLAFKAGFWYTIGNFAGKSIALITTPIFARLMSVSDYGEFMNFSSWAIFMISIVSLGLHNTLSKAYYDFKNEYDDYISSVTILGVCITAAVYSLFLVFSKPILKIVSIPEQYVHLLFFFLLCTFCRGVFSARERTLYRYKIVAIITSISLFVPTLISIFLVYIFPNTDQLSARLYGFYVPSALVGMYCAIKLFLRSRIFRFRYCKYALILSIPLQLHYLAAYLLISTNIMVTKNIAGAGAAAIVSIASSTTSIFTVLSQSISGALTTWLMDNLELDRKQTVKSGTIYYVGILSFIVIFSILFGPEIIYFFGGKKYISSVPLLPGFMYASFIQAVTTIFTIILTYDKNVVKTAVYTGSLAVACIIAKICFLPDYGLIALAYVNIIVFGLLFVINYLLVKEAGYAAVVNFKLMIGIIFITGVFVLTAPWFYNAVYVRYSFIGFLILLFSGALVRFRERLIDYTRKFKKKNVAHEK